MNLISFADDQISNEQVIPEWLTGWNVRVAARAVLLDEDNRVALMHIGTRNTYKLPGGGVDDEEHLEEALKREMLEETGCSIKPICDLGISLEKREMWKLFQISFSYLARVAKKGELILTPDEKEEGFALEWIDNIEKATELVANSPISDNKYDDLYMKIRDKNILLAAGKAIAAKPSLLA